MSTDEIRVAIVGGGMGGLTTAFYLSESNAQRKSKGLPPFRITIYQNGWRLGGKGASGRGCHDRIEEHGLHVWMGFYENAFRLLRQCYGLLEDADRTLYRNWRDAFIEEPSVGLHLGTQGRHAVWLAAIPPNEGLPGDPLRPDSNPFRVTHYVQQLFALLRALILSESVLRSEPKAENGARADAKSDATAQAGATDKDPGSRGSGPGQPLLDLFVLADRIFEEAGIDPDDLLESLKRSARYGSTLGVGALRSLLGLFSSGPLPELPGGNPKTLQFVKDAQDAANRALAKVHELDPHARRCWQLIDIIAAVIRGLAVGSPSVYDDPRALDALNGLDFTDWVAGHGAHQESLRSPFLTGMYELMFARPGQLAAGQALRGAFRMFLTYRGSFFWKMRSGMGDVVFTPMYRVLKRRGVRFEFFHRLHEVTTAEERRASGEVTRYVDRLRFERQAFVQEDFDPLDGRGCWPASPPNNVPAYQPRDRLEWGWVDTRFAPEREVCLSVQKDFDFVVLAVPVDVLRLTCANLKKSSKRWADLFEHVSTRATHGFQWWSTQSVRDLGWDGPRTTVTAISGDGSTPHPFDTWADMTQVLPTETRWPESRPESVHYFCGPLDFHERRAVEKDGQAGEDVDGRTGESDEQFSQRLAEAVSTSTTAAWATLDLMRRSVWPKLKAATIVQAQGEPHSFFLTVNAAPGQRYVLSKPGSLKHRISPLEMDFDNLTVAGDWTDSGYNAGCIEAAVMSGKLASHALSGFPALSDIIGYDHP
jgi:uncharacterized protein with NAD-binding domain and iron-sulfur cluster